MLTIGRKALQLVVVFVVVTFFTVVLMSFVPGKPENVVVPSRRLQDATPVQLTTVVTHRCTSCGMPLSPGETDGCSACSARRSLVSDVWAQYGL